MTDQVDPHQDQLAALDAAQAQQLEALAQQREWALESAKYWESVSAASAPSAAGRRWRERPCLAGVDHAAGPQAFSGGPRLASAGIGL